MITKNASIQIKIKQDKKDIFQEILQEEGRSASTAIERYIDEVIRLRDTQFYLD